MVVLTSKLELQGLKFNSQRTFAVDFMVLISTNTAKAAGFDLFPFALMSKQIKGEGGEECNDVHKISWGVMNMSD